MKKIILITAYFPYHPGEQFLETEIKYYGNSVNLTIMPLNSSKKCRDIPNGIKLDNYFINKKRNYTFSKMHYLMNLLFYKEFITQVGINSKRIEPFLYSMRIYQMYYDIFDDYFKDQKELENTVVYTYWNIEATYALQSLKKKYKYKLVSRIHGGDIYKERKIDCYMPLKCFFTNNIDKVFTITESANKYLSKTYGFKNEVLEVSRLGVDNHFIKCNSTIVNHFSIVSCSFLKDVKRIDKIIDAISLLSKKYPFITFEWNHIGSGPLENKLQQYAKEKLLKNNIKYKFLGHLDNKNVYEFYKNNAIDVFVNVSESEGVPVSIMEAMSCHIPIVAPNVGGISDMIIDKKNGKLLSKECEVNELVDALSEMQFFKSKKTREAAYSIFFEKYNAKKNYTEFIKKLKEL